ncbi:MAG: hypothetical protein ACON5H_11595 [Akkermansiaceae bacterium]
MEKVAPVKLGIGVLAIVLLTWVLLPSSPKKDSGGTLKPTPPPPEKHVPAKIFPEQRMGDQMLADYASESSDGDKDIKLFFKYLQNVFLLIKSRDSHQYAINEDLADFLRGKNDYKTPFVSPDSHIFNQEKMIVDRWGTPIHIHTISRDRFELRSAGPDKKLYSVDDFFWPHPDASQ